MVNEINIAIGYRFKEFRLMNHLRQGDIATVINTTQTTVSFIENGKLSMDVGWLISLAKTYGLNPMFILGLSKNIYLTQVKKGFALNDSIPYEIGPKGRTSRRSTLPEEE